MASHHHHNRAGTSLLARGGLRCTIRRKASEGENRLTTGTTIRSQCTRCYTNSDIANVLTYGLITYYFTMPPWCFCRRRPYLPCIKKGRVLFCLFCTVVLVVVVPAYVMHVMTYDHNYDHNNNNNNNSNNMVMMHNKKGRNLAWILVLLGCLSLTFSSFQIYYDTTTTTTTTTTTMMTTTTMTEQQRQLILPISLSLPEGRYQRAITMAKKTTDDRPHQRSHRSSRSSRSRDFAYIIPGVFETYQYSTEDSYYDSYLESYFGITFQKYGWDCMRHYEIIASGSIPYFINLEHLPNRTMFHFPIHLILKAMNLPGVPNQTIVKQHIQFHQQQQKSSFFGRTSSSAGSTYTGTAGTTTNGLQIDHNLFNETEYNRLQKEILHHSLQYLTWSGTARYMLSMIEQFYPCITSSSSSSTPSSSSSLTLPSSSLSSSSPPRILIVTVDDCEYMSCVIFGGLYEILGPESMSSYFGPKIPLFQSTEELLASGMNLYGKGFSYTNVFNKTTTTTTKMHHHDKEEKEKEHLLLQQRLQDGFFNIILFTNGGNGYCNLRDYDSYFGSGGGRGFFTSFFSSLWYEKTKRITTQLQKYQQQFNPLVIVMDGNDIHGCHNFFQYDLFPLQYHLHFIREYGNVVISNNNNNNNYNNRNDPTYLPVPWTGCSSNVTVK